MVFCNDIHFEDMARKYPSDRKFRMPNFLHIAVFYVRPKIHGENPGRSESKHSMNPRLTFYVITCNPIRVASESILSTFNDRKGQFI